MKNKAMVGGAAGLVLLGAYFLSTLFNGFGMGSGSGKGDGDDKSPVLSSTKDPATKPVSTSDAPGVDLGDVVVVLIDGYDYKVLKSPDDQFLDASNYRPATLEQITKMAKSVKGDEAGIKVQIGMRDTSTAKAESELKDALLEAGIARTSIYEMMDTIP